MNILANRKFWLQIGFAAVMVTTAWWAVAAILKARQFQEAQFMSEQLFKPEFPQIACFGRMVLELPKGAKPNGSLYRYPGAYKSLEESTNVAKADFEKNVQEFEERLRSTKHEKDISLFKSVQDTSSANKVYTHWENEFAEFAIDVTAFAWRDGVQYKFHSQVDLDKAASVAKKAFNLTQNLRNRKSGQVPIEPGFCLDTAFIPDQLQGEEFERTEVTFDIAPWEEANFSVQTFVNQVKEPATLLQRLSSAQGKPGFDQNYSVIRSGKRTVGELQGEELLVLVTEPSNRYFHFMWEVEGKVKRNDPPDIKLELRADQNGKPREMTKTQALALWEYLLPRLRQRSMTGNPTTVPEAGKRVSLGDRQVTGRLCPQTGWWECDDDLDLAQGPGVWLQEGQSMPHAVVWSRPSAWQQLKSERPRVSTAAMWRLAAYEAPPGLVPAAQPGGDTAVPPEGESP